MALASAQGVIAVPTNLRTLLDTLPQIGRVVWIGLRPARKAAMQPVERVLATTELGLQGDRYQGRSGDRQVTLIQAEHLPVVASCLGRAEVAAELLRRNLVIEGINLLALKNQRFCVGSVELEMTGLCHPCSRMETLLGPGGYNAMRGHGGITARVVTPGPIYTGAAVQIST